MLFFVYSRARAGAADAAAALVEDHWSYIDQFAEGMIARGPTLEPDRETWTGSLHIVDLPDAAAARNFVANEPFHRAQLFAEHLVRRFVDRLGRTMWEFPGGSGTPRFLVIGQREPTGVPAGDIILQGDLLTADDETPAGFALGAQAPTRGALVAALGGDDRLAIYDWEFGGRR